MVTTRRNASSGARKNTPNANPPPPNPPSIEQALMTQIQLLQTIAQNVYNNSHQASPRDKCGEFMEGYPPTFSHVSNPLEADDWLRVVERQLNIAQCGDHEKVLYAFGQLQGAALDWCESFQFGQQDANQISWDEFKTAFRSYHVPAGVVTIKKKEFRNLKQGFMSVCEYRDNFTQLSRYAPGEVDNDAKKQERFLEGLNDGVQLQLMTVVYSDFQTLVDRAIVIENKRREMEEKKRRIQSQSTGSNTRPRYTPQQEFQQWYQEPTGMWNTNPPQQFPRYQQEQRFQ